MIVNTSAESYVEAAARGTGEVAELAANRKADKYRDLANQYTFLPIAFETHGTINSPACDFLRDLGRRISQISGDDRETSFFFQRLSVELQRFNSVLFSESFHEHAGLDL